MPMLAWRDDADGFAFSNYWTLDATERAVLSGLVNQVYPAVAAAIAAIDPDPTLLLTLQPAIQAFISFGGTFPYGLCGGMAYTSLDYWRAKLPIPRGAHIADQPDRTNPASAPIRGMIWNRLLDSLKGGKVLERTLVWSLLLNQVPPALGGGAGALLTRTKQEWSKIKGYIDAGQPWPIALVFASTSMWDNHQVLVYGYTDAGDGKGHLLVYDNDAPQQYGSTDHREITLDFTGGSLIATFSYASLYSPPLYPHPLMGFFCSDYQPALPPSGLDTSFGKFLIWDQDAQFWLVTDGVRLPIAAGEITALGGTVPDLRETGSKAPIVKMRPRDGALLRERGAAAVYLYQGGAPFWIPDPNVLQQFGGWGAVRVVPNNTLNAFIGHPDEGTLLREWSSSKIYRIMSGQRRWVTTPHELSKYGSYTDVRVVPDGALAALPEGPILPPPGPGECAALRAELANLNAEIARLELAISDAVSSYQERILRHQLETIKEGKSRAEARATALGCP